MVSGKLIFKIQLTEGQILCINVSYFIENMWVMMAQQSKSPGKFTIQHEKSTRFESELNLSHMLRWKFHFQPKTLTA